MEEVYPAVQVNPLLKAASELIHCLAGAVRDSEAENKKLRQELDLAKAASGEKVELEKVAHTQLSDSKINEFVDYLANHAFIQEENRAKYAAACSSNPDVALDFAMRAIQSAEMPDPQGIGTKKSVTFAGADHDSTAANNAFRAVTEMRSW